MCFTFNRFAWQRSLFYLSIWPNIEFGKTANVGNMVVVSRKKMTNKRSDIEKKMQNRRQTLCEWYFGIITSGTPRLSCHLSSVRRKSNAEKRNALPRHADYFDTRFYFGSTLAAHREFWAQFIRYLTFFFPLSLTLSPCSCSCFCIQCVTTT